MNYWQFKFRNEEVAFQEFATVKDGDIFFTEITENHILKEVSQDTIVFWDRIDKTKGIMLVTKIIGEPYESDEVSSGKAIPMKVIKKFDKPFVLEKNGFKNLHDKLNTKKHIGRVRTRAEIDKKTAERLLNKIIPNLQEPDLNLVEIDEGNLKNTLQLFLENYKQYQEDGKNGYYYNIFMEANIAKQEIRHSSFLANLLKIDGNHFHGNLFFKNFMNELKQYATLSQCEAITEFDIKNYSVQTEEYDDTNDKKGFMDIVIEDENYVIIIENKTGTKDHTGQLIRYKEYAKKKKEKGDIQDYIILYLTPNGEEPLDEIAREDEKIVSISYIDDVYNAMKNSIDAIENKTLKDIIEQYHKSIILYANNLPINWEYELNTINLITQDLDTLKNCEKITQLVNYNIVSKYNFSDEEIEIARWIAKNLIKSKAKIELFFMNTLSLELDEMLTNKNYKFSHRSNIFTNTNEMSEAIDIDLIYEARNNRIKSYDETKDESYKIKMRDKSQILLVHEKIIKYNESYNIFITNDIFGLRMFFYHIRNEEVINHFLETVVNLLDMNEFYSPGVNTLITEKYMNDKIHKTIDKILLGLKTVSMKS